MSRPTVALIHASQASMAPAVVAFDDEFPEAELWHLLDSRLVTDADAAGGLTEELTARMSTLIQYAVDGGADAVQLTCSMFGPVAHDLAARLPVTVLASDQAMFDHVASLRPERVAVLASLGPAAADSAQRLGDWLTAAGVASEIGSVVVTGAAAAASAGDLDELTRLMAASAVSAAEAADVIVLAQYSLAPALAGIAAAVDVPVLSAPHLAAGSLAARLQERVS
ncbi:aspartate/glutamate racemase family protein [Nocardioides sp. NPDC126508]